jgi:hypothetical protein
MNRTSPEPNVALPLDRLLTDYFQAQMPREWPAAPYPPAVVAAARPTSGPWAHRLTLAASVAALLGFGYLLSYGTTDAGPRHPADHGLLKGSTADGSQLKNRLNQTDPMNR